MMQMILECMESLDHVVPLLWQMGKRHGGYGVQRKDYDTVSAVLLEAMQESVGEAFESAVITAWNTLCGLTAATMDQAAAEGILSNPIKKAVDSVFSGHSGRSRDKVAWSFHARYS